MTTDRSDSAVPLAWSPSSFRDVLAALAAPGASLAGLAGAIARSGELACPSPTWDADGAYRVHLDPDGHPQIQRRRGITWWGVMSFHASSGLVPGQPHFTAQIREAEGLALGQVIGPGGAVVLVRAAGSTPSLTRQAAAHEAEAAAAQLNRGVGLDEWLATTRTLEDALADGVDLDQGQALESGAATDREAVARYLRARQGLRAALGLAAGG